MFKFIKIIFLTALLFLFLSASIAFAYTYDSHFDPLTMSNWNQDLIKFTDTQAIIKIHDKAGMSNIFVLIHNEYARAGLRGYSYTYKGEHHLYIYNEKTENYERTTGNLEDWYDKKDGI